ncbi:hypothetical protein SIID45300_03067 [Candidatus Magnetaquicoccaceae bacterium FCR-1]|uniref:DUF3696 domain-containing protein n=1 Tax=Candidatus Magnetaquiglobus chichijimensis TaxID=3141448 RepID=A0ABQ0CCU7_9PROT
MITGIRLRNFKCFAKLDLPLANLTLLTGLNGMGKSTVIQSLLVLRQSHLQGLFPNRGLALNGDLITLGTARSVLYEYADRDEIAIGLRSQQNELWSEFLFKYNQYADFLELDSASRQQFSLDQCLFKDRFQYIQADRLGPRAMFPVSHHAVREHLSLGAHGEYASYFLDLFGSQPVLLSHIRHEEARSDQLLHQVAAWLGEISPGVDLHLLTHENMDVVNLEYSFAATEGRRFRTTSVGFGITYSMPIIVAILSAQPDDLLILENPEAHLHPQGQVRIGELIARAAHAGIQLIVETHSDHILNGMRIAVRQGRCAPNRVAMHFFSRPRQAQPPYQTRIISPTIDENGRIDPWPDGFFDEWEKSLECLF